MLRSHVVGVCLLCLCSISLSSVSVADDLPQDAQVLLADLQENAEAIRAEAERKINEHRQETIRKLKQLQDEYCRQLKLDEAVAIRDKIREISSGVIKAINDPGDFSGIADEQVGRSLLVRVTGDPSGYIWGTDLYTTDSLLATVVVHAGILKAGETGIVSVSFHPGADSYAGSTRNGVTSSGWGPYARSYRVSKVSIESSNATGPTVTIPSR